MPSPNTPQPQQPQRLAFKGLRDPIEVFRVGAHTDKRGQRAEFTAADLDQMAANVTGTGVPSVIGHPGETAPAWAWGKLRRDGDSLFYEAGDIVPAFEAWVDAGHYRERSIAVAKDPQRGWVVQHVGWLGAQPPALDLAPLSYSAPAGAEQVLEFSASDYQAGWALSDVGRLLRGLRDWLIGEKGLDVADKVLPDWTLTSIADAARRITEAPDDDDAIRPMYSAAPAAGALTMPTPNPAAVTEADLERARQEAATAARAEAELRFAAQGRELAELRAERQQERIQTQINGWKAAGQLLPAEEPGLVEFMAALEGGSAAEFAFSRPDQAEVKQTPAAWFAAFMASRKALVKLGAGHGTEAAPEGAQVDRHDYRAIARAAEEYVTAEASKGRTVSAAQAVQHVMAQQGA